MQVSLVLLLPLALGIGESGDLPAKGPPPREEVRRVVAAIVRAAEENAARGNGALKGDALADYYIRRAAAAAQAERVSARAFLIGLGVGLDHTDVLRSNPVTRPYLTDIESSAERKRRLRVLGKASMHGREDWVLHFAISAALTAHSGAEMAEQIGIFKELLDALGTSGFSFADLAADYAGIAFAGRLLDNAEESPRRLRELAEKFEGEKHLPPGIKKLEDGLPWERFVKDYGGPRDPRFRKACEKVRRDVLECPALQASGGEQKPKK